MSRKNFGLAFASGGLQCTINALRRHGIGFDVAQDLAQQAWLIAFMRRDQLRDLRRLQAWINKIAINRWIDLQRGRRLSTLSADACDVSVAPNVNLAAIDAEIALAGCSDRQRALLRLVYIDQEPIRDVARLLSIPVQTVHQRLGRARRAARRALERA